MWKQIVVPLDEPAFPDESPILPDDNLPDRINPATLPESPFSVNWRMYRSGEGFQFTVRAFDALTLLDNMEQLIAMADTRGWALPTVAMANNAMAAPAAAVHVPSVGQQVQQAPRPTSGTATPATSTVETFSGYVVGSYFSKKNNKQEPCVLLYTDNLEFRLFTIYPERRELLPFPYPAAPETVGAPPKAQAMAQGLFHPYPFSLQVYPDLDEGTGQQKMRASKDGSKHYPIWRLPTREEFAQTTFVNTKPQVPEVDFTRPAPPPPPVADLPVRQIPPASKNIAPALDPSKDGLTAQSLRWTMATDSDAAKDFGIPDPLDGWLIEQREKVSHVIDDPDNDRATQKQWDLLGEWVYQHVTADMMGADTRAVTIDGIGAVPLAGVLTGVFIDRFAMEPTDVPAGAVVFFLQRIKEERQPGTPNPMFDANFAENTAEVLRTALATLVSDW